MAESQKPQESRVGAMRAAAVLLGLGPEVASAVFKMLGEAEASRIAAGAKELRRAAPSAVPDALRSFIDSMERVGGDSASGNDVLREIAEKALGPEVARRAFEGVKQPPPPDELLGSITEADPEALAMVLSREQAQTVALVLSALSSEKAAAVIKKIPEEQRAQIIRRMATVESVAPEVLREVRQALTQELHAVVAEGMRRVDGKTAALEALRRTPEAQQREVLAAIEKDDPALAEDLRTRLFTFDDLTRLSDRDLQGLLKEIDATQLPIALKGAGEELREKFLRNMSSRAAELLRDDLAAMGPMKLSTVEAAQAAIAKMTLELAEKGKVTIVRATDKML